MSLLDVVRSAVLVADKVTKPLQSTVTYKRRAGQNGFGKATYATPVQLKAIVDWRTRRVRTASGQDTLSRATVTFLDITALSAATGGDGINDDDVVVLQDGSTGPILDVGGFIDSGTGVPLATEVMLG